MIFNTIALISALVASVSAVYFHSNKYLTHNEAVAFCALNHSQLIDVTTENRDAVISQFPDQNIWIGSWNYDFGRDVCYYFLNGHVSPTDCSQPFIAVCNNQVVYKSTAGNNPADQQQATGQQFNQEGQNANERFQYIFRN